MLARFAFVPSYVVYPRPGCWRLEVTLGSERREVVVEVRAAQPGSQASAGASLSPGASEGQREMNQAP